MKREPKIKENNLSFLEKKCGTKETWFFEFPSPFVLIIRTGIDRNKIYKVKQFWKQTIYAAKIFNGAVADGEISYKCI